MKPTSNQIAEHWGIVYDHLAEHIDENGWLTGDYGYLLHRHPKEEEITGFINLIDKEFSDDDKFFRPIELAEIEQLNKESNE